LCVRPKPGSQSDGRCASAVSTVWASTWRLSLGRKVAEGTALLVPVLRTVRPTTNEGAVMSMGSVIHDTFTIERTYPVPPSKVFDAFASAEAKGIWGDTGNLETAEGEAGASEFDFRVGGRERFGFKMDGVTLRFDARYYDVVPDRRIVYSYEMYADDARISVSVATIQFAKSDEGTVLTHTEQGVYLDGIDGIEAPRLREEGTTEMLDNLRGFLTST
jgi:uncharacterized protein YndB with AHSA1/START domain